jgi:hypothetical protein
LLISAYQAGNTALVGPEIGSLPLIELIRRYIESFRRAPVVAIDHKDWEQTQQTWFEQANTWITWIMRLKGRKSGEQKREWESSADSSSVVREKGRPDSSERTDIAMGAGKIVALVVFIVFKNFDNAFVRITTRRGSTTM